MERQGEGVRRQRGLADADDPGIKPECRHEAAGPWEGLSDEANEGLRFRLIGLPGRAVNHARTLIIRLGAGAEALATFTSAVSDDPHAGMRTRRTRDRLPRHARVARPQRGTRHACEPTNEGDDRPEYPDQH